MKQLLLLLLTTVVSCNEAPSKPKYDDNFTDRAINLALENPGNIVELPGLYPKYESIIVPEKDEHWQIADRLITRGFKERQRETEDSSLSGRKIVSIYLSDTVHNCSVSKIYRSTAYTSRYEVSERIIFFTE